MRLLESPWISRTHLEANLDSAKEQYQHNSYVEIA